MGVLQVLLPLYGRPGATCGMASLTRNRTEPPKTDQGACSGGCSATGRSVGRPCLPLWPGGRRHGFTNSCSRLGSGSGTTGLHLVVITGHPAGNIRRLPAAPGVRGKVMTSGQTWDWVGGYWYRALRLEFLNRYNGYKMELCSSLMSLIFLHLALEPSGRSPRPPPRSIPKSLHSFVV